MQHLLPPYIWLASTDYIDKVNNHPTQNKHSSVSSKQPYLAVVESIGQYSASSSQQSCYQVFPLVAGAIDSLSKLTIMVAIALPASIQWTNTCCHSRWNTFDKLGPKG